MARRKEKEKKTGVVLLVVVSLLALFVLIGVTYVLVASQYRRSATMDARTKLLHIDPQKHLDRAMYQLVRDTYNTGSVLQGHGLLRDMYGDEVEGGIVSAFRYLPGNTPQSQILEVDCTLYRQADLNGDSIYETPLDRPFPRDYFNGRVFTFLEGNPKNLSTRVIDYFPVNLVPGSPNAGPTGNPLPCTPTQVLGTFRLLLPESEWTISPPPTAGGRFIVNGRPFNGTGFGYQGSSSRYLSDEALYPNRVLRPSGFSNYVSGGADEGYDGVDYQNMALAGIIPDRLNPNGTRYIIPSFHRPALINFWKNQNVVDSDGDSIPDMPLLMGSPALMSRIIGQTVLRPLPLEDHHPNFTGGNPHPNLSRPVTYAPTDVDSMLDVLKEGPWDVDNDADGFADSIWVDLGLPAQADESGRLFKPLFAILCVDMDGRINLNAHGSSLQAVREPGGLPAADDDGDTTVDEWDERGISGRPAAIAWDRETSGIPPAGIDSRSTYVLSLPKGQGYGPAEINLAGWDRGPDGVWGMPGDDNGNGISNEWAERGAPGSDDRARIGTLGYWRLIAGNGNLAVGRYNSDLSPGIAGADAHTPFKFFEFPDNYANVNPVTAFFGLPDLNGELAVGVNHFGQPAYEFPITLNTLAALRPSAKVDSAYEMNLVTRQGSDTRFTVAELERILRSGDPDSQSLPDRLVRLVPSLVTDASRRMVTTDSFDLPVPGSLVPYDARRPLGNGLQQRTAPTTQTNRWWSPQYQLTELLRARLQQGMANLMGASPYDLAIQDMVDIEVGRILSPDLLAGMRMNINRPFGNGLDDNGNRVVDEHTQRGLPGVNNESFNESLWASWSFDHNNDGRPNNDLANALARYQYARDLFVMTMLLKDRNRRIDADRDGNINNEDLTGGGMPGGNETQLEIAQWVANVVDFRDADSIMTPIELDLNPFNGWQVDGDIFTDESLWGSDNIDNNGDGDVDDAIEQAMAPAAARERVVVWGSERPELLMTETVAWHDRRTEDLDTTEKKIADPESDAANDFDQRLRPSSAFFVELYNPWAGNDRLPNELYRGQPGVVLDATTPGGQPVWRIIVVRGDTDPPGPGLPHKLRDPDDPNSSLQPDAQYIERGIYFTDPANLPGTCKPGIEQWFPSNPNGRPAPVIPGRYAVIGSRGKLVNNRYTSYLGRTLTHNDGYLDDGSDDPAAPSYDNAAVVDEYPLTRRFELLPDPDPTVQQFFVVGNPGFGGPANLNLSPTVAVAMDQRVYNGLDPATSSLSITDLVGGYPVYDMANPGPGGTEWNGALATGDGAYTPPLDEPLDTRYTNNPGPTGLPRGRLDRTGTLRDYARVHLQRLANPLLDFDPVLNPYRTIDSSSVDVTAFNGVANTSQDPVGETNIRFRSLQRGDSDPNGARPYRRELWSHEPANRGGFAADPGGGVANHYFDYVLHHRMGYLNENYLPAHQQGVGTGAPDASAANEKTFPWLNWLNRPFASQYDLLLVPRSRSSRLAHDYTLQQSLVTGSGGGQVGSYVKGHNDGLNNMPNAVNSRFGHLMNFFESSVDPVNDPALQMHRLFEYTHVPSRYAGTQRWLRPDLFQPRLPAGNDHQLHPPFNWVSMFRDPGRVNINTIFDPAVWNSILDGHQGPSFYGSASTTPGLAHSIVDTRRGYGVSGQGMAQLGVMNANSPTFFGNMFRPTGSGDLVPERIAQNFVRPDIETTVLRSNVISSSTAVGATPGSNFPNNRQPLMTNSNSDNAVNTVRNPYFHYQTIQRLGNLVTTRSNVYAIWITVGYFEVEPNPTGVDVVHPDGYRLGAELRSDSGEVQRHRGFYFLDRSIPVASEPGQNHNVDRAIVLRRYLE